MSSRIRVGRRTGRGGRSGLAAVVAGLVLTVGLALTGCDPSAADGGAKASATAVVTSAPATAKPTPAPPTTTPPPAPSTPAAQPTTAAPQAPATKAPQPKVTTAQPPTDPEPQQTVASGGGGCEIRSSAGNCYEAGQFCRNADLGRSTHDASGRVITCRIVSGKPHWQA
ncbi:hypothetical protein [Streptomyces kaniharaensis]|uniref:hypothetical protein n=1 Tax=Streptomyces kaniharaensis TaxID=212423 RepID=UPI00129798B8|nr:hypothetical protein [Streptomyces kaniharaensis]